MCLRFPADSDLSNHWEKQQKNSHYGMTVLSLFPLCLQWYDLRFPASLAFPLPVVGSGYDVPAMQPSSVFDRDERREDSLFFPIGSCGFPVAQPLFMPMLFLLLDWREGMWGYYLAFAILTGSFLQTVRATRQVACFPAKGSRGAMVQQWCSFSFIRT